MPADKKLYSWGYFIGRVSLLLIFVIPILNTLAAIVTNLLFDLDNHLAIYVWAFSFIWYSWTMLIFVLVPYSLLYIYAGKIREYLIVQFILFHALLALSGFLINDASIIGIYTINQYPRIWLLYFLLTITICPLCNFLLKKMFHSQGARV